MSGITTGTNPGSRNNTGFDLWEEVSGASFFTTISQYRALVEGSALASELQTTCEACDAIAPHVLCFLQSYWSNEGYIISNSKPTYPLSAVEEPRLTMSKRKTTPTVPAKTATASSAPSTPSTRPSAATPSPSSPAATRRWRTTRPSPTPSAGGRSTLILQRAKPWLLAGTSRTCTSMETLGILSHSHRRSSFTTHWPCGARRAPWRSPLPPSPSSPTSSLTSQRAPTRTGRIRITPSCSPSWTTRTGTWPSFKPTWSPTATWPSNSTNQAGTPSARKT
ncbi:hypothetical protein IMZ48_31610 [Candidatus Bathyarchaeota archaeon]|nr:hypothetical protein [Candidatus Bathyarchaeota archaeon]